ncbi:ferredoxin reductase domain-containing protein [Mangrovicoccus ximenensis]|uniref:hypothetical protein n=1 Tax=Mangrovicoccus ximenensis TaxID=1911570 RepID=UPI000D3C042D
MSPPANLFALDRRARRHVLIAGGIGITPFLSQLCALDRSQQPWELHCQHRAERLRPRHRARQVAGPDAVAQLDQEAAVALEPVAVEPHVFLGPDLEFLRISELPLPRRVVHQADQPHAVGRAEAVELRQQRLGRDLGAQMQEMADLQRARIVHRQDLVAELAGIFAVSGIAARIAERPHPHRVEDRGDAAGGQLGVMRHHRGMVRPVHPRARRDMALEIVGMQLDQPGRDDVALAIHRARHPRRTGFDGMQAAMPDHQMALGQAARQRQADIRQDQVGHRQAPGAPVPPL